MKPEYTATAVLFLIFALAWVAIAAGVSGWIVGGALLTLAVLFFTWSLCAIAGGE